MRIELDKVLEGFRFVCNNCNSERVALTLSRRFGEDRIHVHCQDCDVREIL